MLLAAHLLPPWVSSCGFRLRLWPFLVSGYTPGTPYKVSCSPTNEAVPASFLLPNPCKTAVYPVRSAYPQQSPYAQVGLGVRLWVSRGVSWAVCGMGRLLGALTQRGPLWRCLFSFPSKARTTPSPCMQHPSRHPPHHGGAAQRHASDGACSPSSPRGTGSPWAWWRAPPWLCQRVSPRPGAASAMACGLREGRAPTRTPTLGFAFSLLELCERTSDPLGGWHVIFSLLPLLSFPFSFN